MTRGAEYEVGPTAPVNSTAASTTGAVATVTGSGGTGPEVSDTPTPPRPDTPAATAVSCRSIVAPPTGSQGGANRFRRHRGEQLRRRRIRRGALIGLVTIPVAGATVLAVALPILQG